MQVDGRGYCCAFLQRAIGQIARQWCAIGCLFFVIEKTQGVGAGHLAHEEMPARLASIVSQAARNVLFEVEKRA